MFHMKQKEGTFHVKHTINFSENLQKKLQIFETLLKKWQKAINLVSRNSLDNLRERHIQDSVQLFPLIPKEAETLIDMGSGAGFPGLILALMAQEEGFPLQVHLIESDSRKCAFLQECARQLNLSIKIHNCRIEDMPPLTADIITARALADLPTLLNLSQPFWQAHTQALFLKGARVQDELSALPKGWVCQCLPSQTDSSGVIVTIRKETA